MVAGSRICAKFLGCIVFILGFQVEIVDNDVVVLELWTGLGEEVEIRLAAARWRLDDSHRGSRVMFGLQFLYVVQTDRQVLAPLKLLVLGEVNNHALVFLFAFGGNHSSLCDRSKVDCDYGCFTLRLFLAWIILR